MRKLALIACLLVSVSPITNAQRRQPRAAAPTAKPTTTITILQINDVYEISPVDNGERGGLARVATLVKQERARSPHSLLLLAGDFISPSLASGEFKGQQMIDTLNALGLDIATLGNHEFDFTIDVLRERLKESKFTYVAANVFEKDSAQPFNGVKPYVIREMGGIRVAVFGLLTAATASLSKSGGSVTIKDPIATGVALSRRLRRQGVDLIIALTHLSMCEDKRLAAEADIDLIVGGHEHEMLQAVSGRTHISKMGSDARNLGRMDLHLARNSRGRYALKNVDWWSLPVNRSVGEDAGVAAVVKKWEERLEERFPGLDEKIGTTSVELDALAAHVRGGETNLGNFFADAYRQAFGENTDVALVNSGGIRSDKTYARGQILRRDILNILPNKNRLVKLEMKGSSIKRLLENGVSKAGEEDGRFPQVSGMSFSYDPSLPANSRVTSITINGQPIDMNKTYTMVTNQYIFEGGDSYDFKSADVKKLSADADQPADTDVIINFIKAQPNQTIAPAIEGRIKSSQEQKAAPLDPCSTAFVREPRAVARSQRAAMAA